MKDDGPGEQQDFPGTAVEVRERAIEREGRRQSERERGRRRQQEREGRRGNGSGERDRQKDREYVTTAILKNY